MGTIRASARQLEKLRHDVKVRSHTITADEPSSHGGDDAGPSPQELLAASLASCVAITMEMYARRKGWDVTGLRVDCEYTPAERGQATSTCSSKLTSPSSVRWTGHLAPITASRSIWSSVRVSGIRVTSRNWVG